MGRSYAPEFRHRVVQRVRGGQSVKKVAAEVGAAEATVFRWVAQDKVDRGERSGTSSRAGPNSRVLSGGSASWRPSWALSRRALSSSTRWTSCAQKEVPGNRSPDRAGL